MKPLQQLPGMGHHAAVDGSQHALAAAKLLCEFTLPPVA